MDNTCPKCGAKALSFETHGFGIWERHIRCFACGLLHVRGACQDSIQRQINPEAFEIEMKRRIKGKVQISG